MVIRVRDHAIGAGSCPVPALRSIDIAAPIAETLAGISAWYALAMARAGVAQCDAGEKDQTLLVLDGN